MLRRPVPAAREAPDGPWWVLPAVPAALLWLAIAYLLTIEVEDLVTGAGTEHSPLAVVVLWLLPAAAVLTWAAARLRVRR